LALLEKRKDEKVQKPVEDFLRKKLDWFPQGGIVTDTSLMSTLSQSSRVTLDSLIGEVKRNSKHIHDDFLKKIRALKPEELLLTLKVIHGPQERYIGEIPEYVDLFRLAVTRVKEETK